MGTWTAMGTVLAVIGWGAGNGVPETLDVGHGHGWGEGSVGVHGNRGAYRQKPTCVEEPNS